MRIDLYIRGNIPKRLLDSYYPVFDRLSEKFQDSVNKSGEVHLIYEPEQLFEAFPKTRRGYSIPMDINEETTACVTYSRNVDSVPKMLMVWKNIRKDKVLVENLEAAVCHEGMHMITWNKSIEGDLMKQMEPIIDDFKYKYYAASQLTRMVSDALADDGVIEMGYEEKLLNLRKNHAERFNINKLDDFGVLEAATIIASLKLIEKNAKDPEVRKAGAEEFKKLDEMFLEKSEDAGFYKLISEFTKKTIDFEAYKNFEKIAEQVIA